MDISAGAGQIATKYGDTSGNTGDDEDNPWVMGGAAGTGLCDPIAPAPGAPPPPPPEMAAGTELCDPIAPAPCYWAPPPPPPES